MELMIGVIDEEGQTRKKSCEANVIGGQRSKQASKGIDVSNACKRTSRSTGEAKEQACPHARCRAPSERGSVAAEALPKKQDR